PRPAETFSVDKRSTPSSQGGMIAAPVSLPIGRIPFQVTTLPGKAGWRGQSPPLDASVLGKRSIGCKQVRLLSERYPAPSLSVPTAAISEGTSTFVHKFVLRT